MTKSIENNLDLTQNEKKSLNWKKITKWAGAAWIGYGILGNDFYSIGLLNDIAIPSAIFTLNYYIND